MSSTKSSRKVSIKKRIRSVVNGDATSPRLSVFRSNKEIYAQLIDDVAAKTLVSVSSRVADIANAKGTKIDQATNVGKAIAAKALAAGITSARFDRNGNLYHGRVKALADGAREGGLKF
jgi:large subunit ribosomal protein L18